MIDEKLYQQLERDYQRYQQISQELLAPTPSTDFQALAIEQSKISKKAMWYSQFQKYEQTKIDNQSLIEQEQDPELLALIKEETEEIEEKINDLTKAIYEQLVDKDPRFERNCFIEIRAAVGGDESCLFASDLLRMYCRYCENKSYKVENISLNEAAQGGYRLAIIKASGQDAYGMLHLESGGHRVQRVPLTETQGRIHTSLCTVAVMPEVIADDDFTIDPQDLKIDTYRSSGAGGQHVNTTDSAVRITHLPTGVVVECQDERSQHKNKTKAMNVLLARVLDMKLRKQQEEESSQRKELVGSGERSTKIRTYNFPQTRITDHRLGKNFFRFDAMLDGDIQELIDELVRYEKENLKTKI